MNNNTLNKAFLHALVAAILLSPVCFILDVSFGSHFLVLLRGLLRSISSFTAFGLATWLLAVVLTPALDPLLTKYTIGTRYRTLTTLSLLIAAMLLMLITAGLNKLLA